jgi:hypothetical protein
VFACLTYRCKSFIHDECCCSNILISVVPFERAVEFKYLGTALTNQKSIQEDIKSRLKSRNALLLFGAQSFVFQFAIQKFKDQDI